jgi:D-sedoheptulose 7-phosphate isomerase
MKKEIEILFNQSSKIISDSIINLNEIEQSVNLILECLNNDHKVILFGNGGSAADAQHIAAELISRFKKDRKSLPAISLTTDTSILTSIGNDYSFDLIFSRQCESLVNMGDVVIGISTSGKSKNILNGLNTAKKMGAHTIGLLGNSGGDIFKIVDISIIIPSNSTPRIQEAHRTVYHIICELIENSISMNHK